MGGILAFLLVGIVGLAYWYGVMPETETTVLSQLANEHSRTQCRVIILFRLQQ